MELVSQSVNDNYVKQNYMKTVILHASSLVLPRIEGNCYTGMYSMKNVNFEIEIKTAVM